MLLDYIQSAHLELNEMLLLHQEALLLLRLDDAARLLAAYERCLALHMRQEELRIFPRHAALAEQGRWSTELYLKEHEKLRQLLAAVGAGLAEIRAGGLDARQLRRNVLALLEREKTLKGLLEHHEQREESAMFPMLERQLAPEALAALVAELAPEWRRESGAVAADIADLCRHWP